jgi:hypothetical protein
MGTRKELIHVYLTWRGIRYGLPSEVAEWDAKSLWYRLRHSDECPLVRSEQKHLLRT